MVLRAGIVLVPHKLSSVVVTRLLIANDMLSLHYGNLYGVPSLTIH